MIFCQLQGVDVVGVGDLCDEVGGVGFVVFQIGNGGLGYVYCLGKLDLVEMGVFVCCFDVIFEFYRWKD